MRVVSALLFAACTAACSYKAPDTAATDGPVNLIDVPVLPDADPGTDATPPLQPLHVPTGSGAPGSGHLDLTADIDTSALSIGGSTTMPTGVSFDMVAQSNGPAIAVLHVGSLSIPGGTVVRVTGTRALVIVALGEISIAGTIDAGARLDVAGPGGSAPGAGSGSGTSGAHAGTFSDSGGAGGGFATAGGTGGAVGGCSPTLPLTSGGGATIDSNVAVLIGGSGGGNVPNQSSGCGTNPGGGGGGAVQLTSATRITIAGGINVGGGGGGGGKAQKMGDPQCNDTAGAGGGAGGLIVLQSPNIDVTGVLAANGGGGGSSGGDADGNDAPPENDGVAGQNGALGTNAAAGGPDVGTWSSAGGAGGTSAAPGNGVANNDCAGNGGGGGGAAGQIVFALPPSTNPISTGTTSPQVGHTTY